MVFPPWARKRPVVDRRHTELQGAGPIRGKRQPSNACYAYFSGRLFASSSLPEPSGGQGRAQRCEPFLEFAGARGPARDRLVEGRAEEVAEQAVVLGAGLGE